MVAVVCYINRPAPIHGDTRGAVELPITCAAAAPGREKVAVRVELLDPVVAVVRDVDVPTHICRDVAWATEFAITGAQSTPFEQEGAGWQRGGRRCGS